ncbi:MAG: hypothetical protein AAB646_02945 [Patescibacteria group bacterium]
MGRKEKLQPEPATPEVAKPVEATVAAASPATPPVVAAPAKERSDKPRTVEELAKEGKDIESFPVTPIGHDWLKEHDLAYNRRFWSMLGARSRNKGVQRTLAETQAVYTDYLEVSAKDKAEREELNDERPDASAPTKTVTCKYDGVIRNGQSAICGFEFDRRTRVVTRFDKELGSRVPVVHGEGPLKGNPIREGDHTVIFDPETGEATSFEPICPKHRRELRQANPGMRFYAHDRAREMVDRSRARQKANDRYRPADRNRRPRVFGGSGTPREPGQRRH